MNLRSICLGVLLLAPTPIIVLAKPGLECHKTKGFMVVGRGVVDAVGTDFLIKPMAKKNLSSPCEYSVQPGDFEIPNETAEYFLGLQRDLLILDSGTGPSPRSLIIWDIAKRKKVYAGSYSEPLKISPSKLVFWMESTPATEINCPEKSRWQADGLGAAIETKVKLSLLDFKIIKLTNTRCSPRQ